MAYTTHFLLGDCYSRMNNQKEVALQQYKEAKKWAENLKNISKLSDVYHKELTEEAKKSKNNNGPDLSTNLKTDMGKTDI